MGAVLRILVFAFVGLVLSSFSLPCRAVNCNRQPPSDTDCSVRRASVCFLYDSDADNGTLLGGLPPPENKYYLHACNVTVSIYSSVYYL